MSESVRVHQPHSLIQVVASEGDQHREICTCQLRSKDVLDDGRVEFPITALSTDCPYYWRRIPPEGIPSDA